MLGTEGTDEANDRRKRSMPIADPAELFLEELGDVSHAERQLEKALGSSPARRATRS
jgi:hypothetical protein